MTDMLKKEAIKGPTPKRGKLVLAGAGLGVLILAGGSFLGIRAAIDYRSDIAAMEASAAAYYDAAEQQQQLADQAADRAQTAADDASDAVTSLEAAEAEAAAAAAAEAAAAAAAAAEAEGPRYGEYPSGTRVPFVASSDPEDAAGGYYDTSACASGSASTDGAGVPRCD